MIVLLCILGALLLFYLGILTGTFNLIRMYATDYNHYKERILPYLEDIKNWCNSGYSIWKYPESRVKQIDMEIRNKG